MGTGSLPDGYFDVAIAFFHAGAVFDVAFGVYGGFAVEEFFLYRIYFTHFRYSTSFPSSHFRIITIHITLFSN